jgi:hypothetical protein
MNEIDKEVKVCFMTAYDININALRAVLLCLLTWRDVLLKSPHIRRNLLLA